MVSREDKSCILSLCHVASFVKVLCIDVNESRLAVIEEVSALRVSSEVVCVIVMIPADMLIVLRSSPISKACSRTMDVRDATAD